MAPGDLNLKKSWHPGLMKNQEKVWKLEQEALEERKKIQERQLEIAKEKELTELKALQYAKTGTKPNDRMEWMYDQSGVGDGGKLITSEAEDYLLGKKRVDSLIINGAGNSVEEKKIGFDKFDNEQSKISQRDEMARSRDDPMMRIKAQQLKKLEEMRLQKKLEDEKKRSSRNVHRSSHRSHRDSERRSSQHDDDRYRYERDRDERHKSDRHRRDKYRDEQYKDDNYRNEKHKSEQRRDERYRSNRSENERDRLPRHRDDRHHIDKDARRKNERESRELEGDYREPRSYKDDYNSDFRERESKPRVKRDEYKRANISDLERESRLKEMLVNSQTVKNTRDERIQKESDQSKVEEELRKKLLAGKASKIGNDTPSFLQRSKRIMED